ncbi:MAG: EAL domain-containing protein [Dehalococcoidia bacterium]
MSETPRPAPGAGRSASSQAGAHPGMRRFVTTLALVAACLALGALALRSFTPNLNAAAAYVGAAVLVWIAIGVWAARRLDAQTSQLRSSEDRFRALAERAAGGMIYRYRCAPQPGFVYVSAAATRVCGYAPAEHFADPELHRRLAHPEDRDLLRALWDGPDRQSGVVTARWVRKDGTVIWTEQEILAVHDAQGAVIGLDGYVRDITERVQAEQRLTRQAFSDPLTGIPNRALFMDRLHQALARSRRSGRPVAVMFMDLDRFKAINDSIGHGGADDLLIAIGRRLSTLLRPGDTLSRFGGDEFTVLVEDIAEPADAVRVADRFLHAMRRPFEVNGRAITVSTSIGVATPRPDRDRPADLLRDADTALYEAKARGRDRVVFFTHTMSSRAAMREELEAELHGAAGRGELRVYYQPEVDLATGAIVGVEALVRWQHPRHGLITPTQFIGIAEETGLIVPIGQHVLEQACDEARDFLRDCPERGPVTVSVNISPRQIQHPDFVQQVAAALERTGLTPSILRLEVPAVAARLDGEAAEVLRDLKALGVQIALDDFGAGDSSLSSLSSFPLDCVKIDQALLLESAHNSRAAAVIRAVSALAHTLGMHVTAEGIETPEQRAGAAAAHCDRGQGYAIVRPLPGDWVRAVLCTGLAEETNTANDRP